MAASEFQIYLSVVVLAPTVVVFWLRKPSPLYVYAIDIGFGGLAPRLAVTS